ncbi:hypothetical protein MUK42_03921 [Musa troglodytarum]|uniref:Uncharacterized protein n=1 Tax=Musa troglodytarum TaxID=320322 RepID=A0A9E7GLP2_9LILI|nr:hypothetical protein MUK42_03921 [Musa troglodytarum]
MDVMIGEGFFPLFLRQWLVGVEEWERWRSELAALEGLAELPAGGRDVEAGDGAAVAGGDAEGEALAVEVGVALPVLAPVAGHHLPPGLGALDGHGVHVAGARDVGDQHQVEVGVAVDGEPDPALLHARHPGAASQAHQ